MTTEAFVTLLEFFIGLIFLFGFFYLIGYLIEKMLNR